MKEVNDNLAKELEDYKKCVDFLEGGRISGLSSKCNGKYVDSVRTTCIELACNYDVSVRKVAEVVKIVLRNLTDVDIENTPLPSKSSIQNYFVEANAIAKHHVAERLLGDFDVTALTGNVSHSDATTKNSKHYQEN